MSKIKTAFWFLALLLIFSTVSFAQTSNQTRKSYEILLQVLESSASSSEFPAALSSALKKLKQIYPSQNFALTDSILAKAADGSYLTHRRLTKAPGQSEMNSDLTAYLELSLDGLKSSENRIEMAKFAYGLRVPIRNSFVNSDGKSVTNVNYDQIGITVSNLILQENIPTIIGTLTASKPNEIIVLVLTVKSESF